MHNRFYLFILFLLPVFWLYSCANIKPPQGGPKDTTAPSIKRSTPPHNSTNYKGKEIVLDFDEYVDAQKLSENIIISPLIEGKYDIVTRKKTVFIRFSEPFKENTTYNINFSQSIRDVTENNFSKETNLAFSTGPVIDSLSVRGQAYDFHTGKGIKDINIQLYTTNDTNTIRNSKPRYISRTDKDGNFIINNIKEGTYNLYALNDRNKNFRYDGSKEEIAYINNMVVNKPSTSARLGLTRSDKDGPEIISSKQEYEYYLLGFNEGLENYSLLSDSVGVLSSLSDDGKTLTVFDNFNVSDSIALYCQFRDSSDNVSTDTIRIIYEKVKEKNKKNTFSFSVTPVSLETMKNEFIVFRFNRPIGKINYPEIKIRKDTTYITPLANEFKEDSTGLKISFLNNYTFKDSLVFTFQKGAFMNLIGDSSAYKRVQFRNKNEENYGILAGTVECSAPDYIFQLINSKGKIVDSKKNITKFYYKMLEPGEYRLKLIIDVNRNGRWDATDLDNDLPPEPIYFYKEKINLRANWELLDIKFVVNP